MLATDSKSVSMMSLEHALTVKLQQQALQIALLLCKSFYLTPCNALVSLQLP